MPFPPGLEPETSHTEGYTRAAAVFPPTTSLDNLRPPGAMFNLPISASLGPATSAAGPNGPENSAYVTLQRLDGRGFNPVDQEDLSSGGGSLTPVVTPTSPTSLASAASIHGKYILSYIVLNLENLRLFYNY